MEAPLVPQIARIGTEIDRFVYELYCLNEERISMVGKEGKK